jgi:phosphoribosylformylglycinamidine synthase
MKIAVGVCPGGYCYHDCLYAVESVLGCPAAFVWHQESSLQGFDAVILPGGFSYGDYLRPGAIARFSPVMNAVWEFAARGGPVIGICNGFQMLTEAGLLPGALLPNVGMKYICRYVHVRAETASSPFTSRLTAGEVLHIPIGHGDGNYVADPEVIRELEDADRVAFRYVDETGDPSPGANPNGSLNNIAGVLSEGRNVLGLMPHPERSDVAILGSRDGARIFESMAAGLEMV